MLPESVLPVTFLRATERARSAAQIKQGRELLPERAKERQNKTKKRTLGGIFFETLSPADVRKKSGQNISLNGGTESANFLSNNSFGEGPRQKRTKSAKIRDAFLQKRDFWQIWRLATSNAKNGKMCRFAFALSS